MISAKIILDSIGEHSPRLTTFLVRYPKFIHAEHMRHRTGSYCVSSSRAVPVSKNLEEVRSAGRRAGPVKWPREQKGMSGGEDISAQAYWEAAAMWETAATMAANVAESMAELGVHKSIVNRLIEPFLHVNVLVTSCEPGLLNFFGLRLDKATQPEIRALAEEMWKVWNESKPNLLNNGDWHLPFVDSEAQTYARCEHRYLGRDNSEEFDERAIEHDLIRISVARCARLSYTSFETNKRSTLDEDLKLYDRLVGAHPIHASPAEHQATPDVWTGRHNFGEGFWQNPKLHGNLPGWIQNRKLLPGEAIAPLPEGYGYYERL